MSCGFSHSRSAIMASCTITRYSGVIKICPEEAGGIFVAYFTRSRGNNVAGRFAHDPTLAAVVAQRTGLHDTGMVHGCRLKTGRADMAIFARQNCLNMIRVFWSGAHNPTCRMTSGAILWCALKFATHVACLARDRNVRPSQGEARIQMVEGIP